MNKLIAELIGTFALVFAGTGAIIINDLYGGVITHVGIALTFGLIVIAMIYSIGNISGAHINPAVTIGFAIARKFPISDTLRYILVQIIGACSASIVLRILFPSHSSLGATIPSGSLMQSFIMEILLSFILMFVILNVSTGAKEKGIMAGVAIGGTVALAALFAGPVCGASMNPARSIGPALISGNMAHLWIYCIAPVIGMVLATPFCKIIQGKECCPPTDY